MSCDPIEYSVSAPGKIILFGEHAVVYGKTAVASCISLRTHCRTRIVPFADGAAENDVVLSMTLRELQVDVQFTLAQLRTLDGSLQADTTQAPSPQLLEQVKSIHTSSRGSVEVVLFLYAALLAKSGKKINEKLSVNFESKLPLGAGLGSSASFSVTVAASFLKYFGFVHESDLGLENRKMESLELINQWALVGEKIFHANPSGVDNAVSTFGNAIVFENRQASVTEMPSLNIMLINTCIPRNTKFLVQGVRVRYDAHPKVMSSILDTIDSIGKECVELFAQTKSGEITQESLYEKIGDLMDINQGLLNAINVGHSALDRICWLAKSVGLKAKLTGGGGGGCALILLPDNTSEDAKTKLTESLAAEGFQVMQVSIGGPGVTMQ